MPDIGAALPEENEKLVGLPVAVYRATVTHSLGDIDERQNALARMWEHALLGTWPERLEWPPEEIQWKLAAWLEQNKVLELCRGSEVLVEQLLLNVLKVCEQYEREVSGLIDQYRISFWNRVLSSQNGAEGVQENQPTHLWEVLLWMWVLIAIDTAVTEELDQAVRPEAVRLCIASVEDVWLERLHTWQALQELFGPLGKLCGLGWDLAAGIFHSHGWRELLRYSELIKRIPEIRQMIEELGRLQTSEEEDTDPTHAEVFNSLRRTTEELREVEHPLARHQAQGIERSDDFIRMIPSEAMLRRRPGLKRLWHAKLAERGLLTYRVRGTYVDSVSVEIEEQQPQSKKRIRGPIIVCVDTSGSMSGRPEAVAKALTLEACRIAHAEQRRCLLYFFGSTNEFREHELSLDPDGLNRLMDFFVMGFGGGNDLDAPFREALKRLKTAEWERADILLVSDGIFPQSQVDALKPAVDEAKEKLRLRVCGLLVGKHTSEPMKSLCDPLIEVSSW
jgi:uncharacterized protein with von Willebrand factor type A (vWA) domain